MTGPAAGARPGFLRSAAVYGSSNVLERAIPALLLPVLTRFLTTADYGLIAVFNACAALASPFVGFNTPSAIRRRYFGTEPDRFRLYVANCVGILVTGTAAGCLLMWILGGTLPEATGLPRAWLVAAVILSAGQVFLLIPLSLWQVEHRPGRYAMLQVGRSAGFATLSLALVVGLGMDWRGSILASLGTTMALALAIGVPAVRARATFHLDRAALSHALRYGGGLIPHTLGIVIIASTDRFFIAYFVGSSETGLYWVAYQFGFLVAMAADAFNRAWSPWLFERLERQDDELRRRIVRLTYAYFGAILAGAVAVSILSPFLIRGFLGSEFHGAERFVWWLALAFAANGMYRVVSGLIFYSGRTILISWITGAAALSNLALNFLLVPRHGALGAAQASLVAFSLSFLLTWAAGQKVQPMPWTLRRRQAG